MVNLMPVDEAISQILATIVPLGAEACSLDNALDRVLAQDIIASINLPPFANSAMDGYAVRAADITGAGQEHPVELRVINDIPAGHTASTAVATGEAARIMTGAPLPEGADSVVPVENTDDNWTTDSGAILPELVRIYQPTQPGDHVRPIGEDIRTGQTVLVTGTRLDAPAIGMLAAVGCTRLSVRRRPRVTIISTGDELVTADEALAPGKIRDVNSHTLAAMVRTNGGEPVVMPIGRDSRDEVRALFASALAQKPDMILSSAGVSVGAADFVRDIMNEMGRIDFWRINLRPGKPLAFGNLQGIPFFGLPGNPVSAIVTFEVLVRPALLKMAGRQDNGQTVRARTAKAMQSDGRRSYIRVKLEKKDTGWVAHSTGTQSSGALMSLVMADGLLIIPEGVTSVAAETELDVHLIKPLNRRGS